MTIHQQKSILKTSSSTEMRVNGQEWPKLDKKIDKTHEKPNQNMIKNQQNVRKTRQQINKTRL